MKRECDNKCIKEFLEEKLKIAEFLKG